MRFVRILNTALVCAALVGCVSIDTTKNDQQSYPYFTTLPSVTTLKEQYSYKRHELSPIQRYWFRIAVPKDWETLDLILEKEPQPGQFIEMGVFREPGNWEKDETTPQDAEITITTVNNENEKRWASVWLRETIMSNAPDVKILEERTIKTDGDEAADILFSYKQNGQTIMTRMAAFRDNNRFFVISASDSLNGYRDNAEAFYTAIGTFALDRNSDANPFYVK